MADRSPGLFDVEARLAEISAKGDGLERVAALVDFELFRPTLEAAVPRRDRSRGGRPPFDHVLMLKVLIVNAGEILRRLAGAKVQQRCKQEGPDTYSQSSKDRRRTRIERVKKPSSR